MLDRAKRLIPRYTLAFPVLVEDPNGNIERCMAKNVSTEGIYLECRKFFPIGSKLKIIFTPPEGNIEVKAEAEVTRAMALGPRTDDPTCLNVGMGLKFLSFDHSIVMDLQGVLPI